jgi:glutamate racemase
MYEALEQLDERQTFSTRSGSRLPSCSGARAVASADRMIGLFDSGHGGLTVLRALTRRFPKARFVYFGDHANAPYGDRPSPEIVALTRAGVETLFGAGCRLVLLACNTATCVAARTLQRDWLPTSHWRDDRNLLGIVAPTVEAATQTPWAVTTPQYPQKFNTDVIVVFGTTRTIQSNAYADEIAKRCPRVTVVGQACPGLAGAIEAGATVSELDALVGAAVRGVLERLEGTPPHRAILGCTHFPLVEDLFRRHLPAVTRILSQPDIVADSLDDYLARHPRYLRSDLLPGVDLTTSGDVAMVGATARRFWPEVPDFGRA